VSASYTKPFIAHASIGTVCAVADYADTTLSVWSQTQGVYPLRDNLATVFGLESSDVTVTHIAGAGCYGHNGADDVALDAALLAKACRRPVRVVWTRADELSAAPLGSAMLVEIESKVDSEGRIKHWKSVIHSLPHLFRPGWGDGVNLLAASSLEKPFEASPPMDPPLKPFGGGAVRNAVPLYDIPNQEIDFRQVESSGIRTSALRSLGAFANVFSIESLIDDLALQFSFDPIEYRLSLLSDKRAINVLKELSVLSSWNTQEKASDEFGRGVGFAQYKNNGAYFACVAELSISHELKVTRIYAVVDAGLIINPDGVLNQIEGGIVQAISWTLYEQVVWNDEGIASKSWEDYPILNFSETPEIIVKLINGNDKESAEQSFGVGECAAGPISAAIANAVNDAMNVRVTSLPITPEKIIELIS